ncbi:MAG: 3D domain-containing protein [Cellulosilyticum sp.]|nr:3D domain-containing protein [Cellulosilyticum sp.]
MRDKKNLLILVLIFSLIGGGSFFHQQYIKQVDSYGAQISLLKDSTKIKDKQINDLTYERNILLERVSELEKQQEQSNKVIEDKGSKATYKITHYSSEETGSSMTASGKVAQIGRTVACNSLPLGTRVRIGGNEYIVEDTGGMGDSVIDIYVGSTSEAMMLGTYYAEVEIIE